MSIPFLPSLKSLPATVAVVFVALPLAAAQQGEAWTAFASPIEPAVQTSKTATDGRTVFLGGCAKEMGVGFDGSFALYDGDALQRIDGQSEAVSFDVEGRGGAESFPGQLRYDAQDKVWWIAGRLSPAFVDAFGRGDSLTIHNAGGEVVMSFGLRGSSKAAQVMHQVCGF